MGRRPVKRLARRIHLAISIFALEQCEGRGEDEQIEHQRPVLDVMEIMVEALRELLLGVGLAAPAIDLRPAGDARLDAMAGEIAVDDLGIETVAGLVLAGRRWGDSARACH